MKVFYIRIKGTRDIYEYFPDTKRLGEKLDEDTAIERGNVFGNEIEVENFTTPAIATAITGKSPVDLIEAKPKVVKEPEKPTEAKPEIKPEVEPEAKPPVEKPIPSAGKPQLIQFTTAPEVYDISEGTLRHISDSEFASKGYLFSQVTKLDPKEVGMKKDPDKPEIFVTIQGKDIHIPDWQTFERSGLSWSVLKGGEPETWVPNIVGELEANTPINIAPKLKEIYNLNPEDPANPGFHLQDAYSFNGKGKGNFVGDTLEQWAMRRGWIEHPDILQYYSPQNVVRAAYYSRHNRDPFDPAEFDPNAYAWTDIVKAGQIESYADLINQIETDPSGEWAGKSEEERSMIWTISHMPEEEIKKFPGFEEFFDPAIARKDINARTEARYKELWDEYLKDVKISETRATEDYTNSVDYYKDQLSDYLDAKKITEARWIEDTERLMGELSDDEERELTQTQRQFRQSLQTATEGYGMRGLAFSTQRMEAEKGIKEVLGETKEEIETRYKEKEEEAKRLKERKLTDLATEEKIKQKEWGTEGRLVKKAQLTKTRELEDIARKKEVEKMERKQKKQLEIEEELRLKEREERAKYIAGRQYPGLGLEGLGK